MSPEPGKEGVGVAVRRSRSQGGAASSLERWLQVTQCRSAYQKVECETHSPATEDCCGERGDLALPRLNDGHIHAG